MRDEAEECGEQRPGWSRDKRFSFRAAYAAAEKGLFPIKNGEKRRGKGKE